MLISQILQHLYSLDTSSPDFLRNLDCLIRYDEEEQYLTGLHGSELARLVDFLDEVRVLLSAFCPATKRALQTLTAISNDGLSQQCLHKLQAICSHHATLPSTYIVFDEIARMGDNPIALGGLADLWEGTHGSKKVSIKCLRVSTKNHRALKKVCAWYGVSSLCLLMNTCHGRCSHSSKRPLRGNG